MRRVLAVISLLGLLSGAVLGQGQPSQQQPGQTPPAPAPPSGTPSPVPQGQPENQPAPPPVKPPRVVGQPQTEQEREAWMAIERAASFEEKGQLAENFLTQFPESGLTPFAHQVLAFRYQQVNDYEKFMLHAEKSLEEVPENPVLLTLLAAAYAQRNQADKATARAQQALQLLQRMEKPGNMSEAEWVMNREQLEADSHYALGVASLARHSQTPAANISEDQNLKTAIEELQKAIELDPAHERGYFQLGFAFARQNNGEKSIQAYARAAAIGGAVQPLAREQLGKVYEFVFKSKEGVEQVIEREKEYINEKVAQRQARLQALQTPAPPAQSAPPATTAPAPAAPPAPRP